MKEKNVVTIKDNSEKEQNKGITLIALVVTIIILLILAGITISSLKGNGLITKTQQAAEKTKYVDAKESLQLMLLGIKTRVISEEKRNTKITDCNELEGEDAIKKIEYKNEGSSEFAVITYKDYIFNVDDELNIIENDKQEEKEEIWIKIMQAIGKDYSKYNSKAEALSDLTVIEAIKNNVEALKLLPKDKEAFDIVCKKDTSVDEEVIKNGIVPQMTSNTSPEPYVVNVTTEYAGLTGYRAFDLVTDPTKSRWHSDNTKPQRIEIDMGTETQISSFSITSTDSIEPMPRDFTIEGSYDGSNWTSIKEYNNFSDYIVYETTSFSLDKAVNYRYYRFNISKDNGFGYIVIPEIQFYN